MLDENGQQLNRLYSRKRLNDRTIDELIGLSRGLIADKNVNKAEAEFLRTWIDNNLAYCNDPVVNQLYCRVNEMLMDNVLDAEEQQELFQILSDFTGESTIDHCHQLSSSLPLCSPPPTIEFLGRTFCLTGKFAYGPRSVCQDVVIERGGFASGSVTQKIDYLVVGTFCSTDWIHTSYGRKIMKASEYREKGIKTSIISEDHWARAAFTE